MQILDEERIAIMIASDVACYIRQLVTNLLEVQLKPLKKVNAVSGLSMRGSIEHFSIGRKMFKVISFQKNSQRKVTCVKFGRQ